MSTEWISYTAENGKSAQSEAVIKYARYLQEPLKLTDMILTI